MIQSNDLRIGNYVSHRTGTMTIGGVQIDCVEFMPTEDGDRGSIYDDIDGIPLTEEWLIRFGFEKNVEINENAYEFPKRKYPHLSRMGLFFLHHTITGIDKIDYYNLAFPGSYGSCYLPSFNQCRYVHQLQNLYYVLTGEELGLTQ